MQIDNKRLLIELERVMKEINRNTINPLFNELSCKDIEPIMEMVAKARGNYIKELFRLSELSAHGQKLNTELVKNLRFSRLIFDELVEGYKTLDSAIDRGYLDVK